MTVDPDELYQFIVEVSPESGSSYQWQVKESASSEWRNFTEKKTALTYRLWFTVTGKMHGWQFRCIIKNGSDQVISTPFTVKIRGKDGQQEAKPTATPTPTPKPGAEVPAEERYPEAKKVLDQVGWDLKAAFNWSAGLKYYGHNSEMPDTAAPGIMWYADYGFQNKKGNCYVMAATFYEMAVLLGYDAKQISGSVGMRSGGYGPHSWVEITLDGTVYVYDPNFTNETKRNGFKISYGQSGTWRYKRGEPMKE